MPSVNTTGNADIDTATAEIAVALRDAAPGKRDQEYYDEAMRLLDAIMKGTREHAVYSVDVTSACHLKPGDRYAGDVNPDAPTRPVQPFAAACLLTDVEMCTDDDGVKWMHLSTTHGRVLTPVRYTTWVLVIRRRDKS